MRKTTFAGLTVLEPGEPLSTDGGSFLSRNPEITDHFLKLIKTHVHDGHDPLADPVVAATLTTDSLGGTLPPDLTVTTVYTLVDSDGGETLPSPVAAVTTASAVDPPQEALTAVVDYTAGTLVADVYAYVVTLTDDLGGETPAGPVARVTRDPGSPTARIALSNLSAIVAASPGATGWRLFRAKGSSSFDFLAAGTAATDAFTDDGTTPVDCGIVPPDTNTTNGANQVTINVPALPVDATGFRIYVSTTGDFTSPSLLGATRLPAEAGVDIALGSLVASDGAPPDVSTSIGGSSPILGAGHTIEDETTPLAARASLAFEGSGVTATDDAAGDRTVVTIPGGGGGGGTAYPVDWSMDLSAVADTNERGLTEDARIFTYYEGVYPSYDAAHDLLAVQTPRDRTPLGVEWSSSSGHISPSDPGAPWNPVWDRQAYLEFVDGPEIAEGSVTVRFQLASLPAATEHFDAMATIAQPRGARYAAGVTVYNATDPEVFLQLREPYLDSDIDELGRVAFTHAFAINTDYWVRLTRAASGTLTAEVFIVDPAGVGATPVGTATANAASDVFYDTGYPDFYGWSFRRNGGLPGAGAAWNGVHSDHIRINGATAHATAGGAGGPTLDFTPRSPQAMTFEGAYDATRIYTYGQVVTYSGVTYVSIDYDHLGQQPDTTPLVWTPL